MANESMEMNTINRTPEEAAVEVVERLSRRGKTIAAAESCTGGMVAAALTSVSGSSRVIGTGVVAYSWDCKKKLLGVDGDVLEEYGAVSSQVARQMARGVRELSGADIGVSVTGEAGPVAGEQQPVGTVFIALADARRTWVKELHLEGGREEIRRAAAAAVLELACRYIEAYPAVMAGGERHGHLADSPVIPKAKKSGGSYWLWLFFPHRGDSLRRLLIKSAAWILAAAVLVSCLWLGYLYLLQPDANRDLQENLGALYRGETDTATDVSTDAEADGYPTGMMVAFRGLYDRNPDVVGWVRVADTPLDYPVMAYKDGFYENHSFDEQYSLYGQPHFNDRTALSTSGKRAVTVIEGRNTGNGQMFSSLMDYRRLAYLKKNAVIEFSTLYTAEKYEIFAVMVLDSTRTDLWDHGRTVFDTKDELTAHIEAIQARSLYRTDGVITADDSLLMLTTDARQEYGFAGAVLAVVARRVTDRDAVTAYHINGNALMPSAMQRPVTVRQTSATTRSATTATTVKRSATTATTSVVTSGSTATVTEATATTEITTQSVSSTTLTTTPSTDKRPAESTTSRHRSTTTTERTEETTAVTERATTQTVNEEQTTETQTKQTENEDDVDTRN